MSNLRVQTTQTLRKNYDYDNFIITRILTILQKTHTHYTELSNK